MFWQIIAANKRRTVVLVVSMGVVLALCGYFFGIAYAAFFRITPVLGDTGHGVWGDPAGMVGLGCALIVWAVLLLVSLVGSDQIFLSLAGAHEVDSDKFPQLINVVEEMKIAGALPAMPKVYIVDDPSPNAFALGKSPERAMICVTAGLLAVCTRDELQGVVAHEMGHILNRDVLYLTVAATMLGAVTLLSDVFWKTARFAPIGRYRPPRSGKRGGAAAVAVILIAVLFLILSPLLVRILYFSISRRREYLADATSARLTRYPEGLASALEKIMRAPVRSTTAPAATAPFYIVNPYKQDLAAGLFATHPPLTERIKILRAMTRGAAISDYVKAYWSVTKTRAPLIPTADLRAGERVEVRGAADGAGTDSIDARHAADIIRGMNAFTFIACACGMKLKVPPHWHADRINCPRCNREHRVTAPGPQETQDTLRGAAAFSRRDMGQSAGPEPRGMAPKAQFQQATRIPGSWQAVVCNTCGAAQQISPSFGAQFLKCRRCGQVIILIREGNAP
ncbi:MAG TPA: M48 family metallopeptidase [Deltaproteobacteria bacterium]|nr:M48 family metallopeptidase [Deltaproteobacteria bacterium]